MCSAVENDNRSCPLYDRALQFFYEGRSYQSSEDHIKALQKYEEAFLLFQRVTREDSKWAMKAKKKMRQIDRDVRRMGMNIYTKQLGSSKTFSKDAQVTLEYFEEWRRQEKNMKGMS